MLPDFDVQTWRLPTHSWDLQQSVQLAPGWAWEPLWAEDPDESFPIIEHLGSLDLGAYRRFGPIFLSADVPLRAVWDGEVGIANPRLSLASAGSSGLAASVLFPYDTLSTPISNPGWSVSGTIFTRLAFSDTEWLDVSGGADFRTESAYGSGAHFSAELYVSRYSAGARGSYLIGKEGGAIVEALASGTWESSRLRFRPEVGVGLTSTPGTPKLRGVLTISTLPKPAPKPEVPPEPAAPPSPPAPEPVPVPEPEPQPQPQPEPARPPPPRELVVWAVIEVHPPCGVDPAAWTAPRAAAARSMLVRQGVEEAHIEEDVLECVPKPFIQVRLDRR